MAAKFNLGRNGLQGCVNLLFISAFTRSMTKAPCAKKHRPPLRVAGQNLGQRLRQLQYALFRDKTTGIYQPGLFDCRNIMFGWA